MTVYRATERMRVFVASLGRDVTLDPSKELDDQFPEDAAVIAEWAPRGMVRQPNVEAATAAPGEMRNTRRPKKETV